MVNFMCQLDWAKGCPDSWYSWVCLGVYCQKRLAFSSVDGASSNPLRNWIEQKGRGRVNLVFCLSWDIHILLPLDTGTPDSQAFRLILRLTPLTPLALKLQTWAELHHWLSWFSSLQMADHGTSRQILIMFLCGTLVNISCSSKIVDWFNATQLITGNAHRNSA